jgi:hypothetical protein
MLMQNRLFMNDSFIVYIERLELLTFFSGYPLVYTFAHFIAGSNLKQRDHFKSALIPCLPKGYALAGTIFFLLLVREVLIPSGIPNMAPGYNITPLKIWGLLAFFFWIPALNRKPYYSLLHSMVFFIILFKDLITGSSAASGKDILSNDMKVYTVSLVLNILCLFTILTINWIFRKKFPSP